jgi:hypothetical protein
MVNDQDFLDFVIDQIDNDCEVSFVKRTTGPEVENET